MVIKRLRMKILRVCCLPEVFLTYYLSVITNQLLFCELCHKIKLAELNKKHWFWKSIWKLSKMIAQTTCCLPWYASSFSDTSSSGQWLRAKNSMSTSFVLSINFLIATFSTNSLFSRWGQYMHEPEISKHFRDVPRSGNFPNDLNNPNFLEGVGPSDIQSWRAAGGCLCCFFHVALKGCQGYKLPTKE